MAHHIRHAHYVIRQVGQRYIVTDAHSPKGEPAVVIGVIKGNSTTGYILTRWVKGQEFEVKTLEPVTRIATAAQVLYLEFLFHRIPAKETTA